MLTTPGGLQAQPPPVGRELGRGRSRELSRQGAAITLAAMVAARLRPVLLLAAACLLGLPAPLAAVQGGDEEDPRFTGIIVATTWEVRREAAEILDDLLAERGRTHQLLERIRRLLAEHAEKPMPVGDRWVPIGEVFAAALAESGLDEAFVDHYAPTAQLEFDRIMAAGFDRAAVADLARRYPLTETARRAWALLADHAWDRGRLGAYLHYGRMAGEPGSETPRGKRFAAARALLERPRSLELPASLEALAAMWSVDTLPAPMQQEDEDDVFRQRHQQQEPAVSVFLFSDLVHNTVALSDGRTLMCVDPLFGERFGPAHELAAEPTLGDHNRPVVDSRGFVAVSLPRHRQPVVYAIDRDGKRRWDTTLHFDSCNSISRPLPLDDLIIAAATNATGGGTELWVVAIDAETGTERWRTLIAKDQRGINHRWRFQRGAHIAGPSVATHAGTLFVCTHNGLLARVSSTGILERAWNYGSADGAGHGRYAQSRAGNMVSDGDNLVVAPADATKLLIFRNDQVNEPEVYTGTASGDLLLDLKEGEALLAGTTTSLLQISPEPTIRWRHDVTNTAQPRWGRIGRDRVLVLADAQDEGMILHLHARDEDRVLGTRSELPSYTGIGIAGDQVLVAHPDPATNQQSRILIGYGDERGFQRLQARVAAEPENPRPLIGLASLYRARGEFAKAFEHLYRALDLEVSEPVIDGAARFARRLCDHALGTEGFTAAVERFDRLAAFEPSMAGEALWWRGRQASRRGDNARAVEAFSAIDRTRSHLVVFEDGLAVDLLTLADLALVELGVREPLPYLDTPPRKPARLAENHMRSVLDADFMLPPTLVGGLVIGYSSGQLRAYSASDGSEVWTRPIPSDEVPFLGVRMVGEDGPGLLVEVIAGTSASGAGIHSGDRLVEFAGTDIEDFQRDLVPAIHGLAPGDRFTCSVLRADPDAAGGHRRIDLAGTLGTRPVHPLSATDELILVSRYELAGPTAQATRPDTRHDPHAEILDVATGRLLWSHRHAVPWRDEGDPHPTPHLLADGRVLIGTGDDLKVVDPTRPDHPLWTIQRAADTIEVSALPGGALAVARNQGTRLELHHPADGRILARLPVDANAEVLLAGGDAIGRLANGRLAAWNLTKGRRLWERSELNTEALAIRGDAVFAIDEQGRLLIIDRPSGETRRTYAQWASINDHAIASDRLFIYASVREGGNVIAAIGLRGGSVLWQRSLPDQLELKGSPLPVEAGVACVLGGRELSPGVLLLDGQGEAIAVRQIANDQRLVDTSSGVLISGAGGIEVLETGLPAPGTPLATVPVDASGDLSAIAQAAVDAGDWNEVGDSAYLVARSGSDLLLIMRVSQQSEGLVVHVGDGGEGAESPAIRLSLKHRHSPVPEGDYSSWKVTGVRRVAHEDPQWTVVVRLSPTPDRAPGTVRVRAEADDEVDGPMAPWWRRESWRPLTDPGAATP